MKLKPIDRRNAYESVRDRLLTFFEQGEIEPGGKLPSESDLAKALQVSRPVVREALGSLRAMGLVRSETGRGTFFVSTTCEPAAALLNGMYTPTEIHEVRVLLETAAAGLAARRCTDDQLREIEAALARFASCGSASEYAACDVDFHLAVGRASGNRVLESVLAQLRGLIGEESVLLAGNDWQARWVADHEKISQAIVSRDVHAAEGSMKNHLRKIHHQLLARLAVGFSRAAHSVEYQAQHKPGSWLETERFLVEPPQYGCGDLDFPDSTPDQDSSGRDRRGASARRTSDQQGLEEPYAGTKSVGG